MDTVQQRQVVLKKISVSDSQLVWIVEKKGGWPLREERCQLQEEQRRGRVSFASVTSSLLYKKAVGHLLRGVLFFRSISLYLSAYLPPLPTLHSFFFLYTVSLPTHLFQALPFLSLCQPTLNQTDCRCVSTAKEDSLLLNAGKPPPRHTSSSDLLCHNLSMDPKHS